MRLAALCQTTHMNISSGGAGLERRGGLLREGVAGKCVAWLYSSALRSQS